jgi:hypothetical protein
MKLLGGVDQHSEIIGERNWNRQAGWMEEASEEGQGPPGAVEPMMVVVVMMMTTMMMTTTTMMMMMMMMMMYLCSSYVPSRYGNGLQFLSLPCMESNPKIP